MLKVEEEEEKKNTNVIFKLLPKIELDIFFYVIHNI